MLGIMTSHSCRDRVTGTQGNPRCILIPELGSGHFEVEYSSLDDDVTLMLAEHRYATRTWQFL